MSDNSEILSLFHHIHHNENIHKVHHCGEEHVVVNPKLNYKIIHCDCGKHRIDKNIAIGHVTDVNLCATEIRIKFLEKCSFGGWHIESGVQIIDK